jgi:glutamate-1-semialdehyde 2,1-aminomutase
MLPDARIADVGEGLAALFGLPWWQLTQTATDANRAVLRQARMATGRPRVLVFDRCYHGTVEETMVVMGEDGSTQPRPGQVGRIHDPAATTVVVEFNDIDAVEAALARGDIACVLAEPVMTNAGMVLPQPGFLDALRRSCTRHDVLLAIEGEEVKDSAGMLNQIAALPPGKTATLKLSRNRAELTVQVNVGKRPLPQR